MRSAHLISIIVRKGHGDNAICVQLDVTLPFDSTIALFDNTNNTVL